MFLEGPQTPSKTDLFIQWFIKTGAPSVRQIISVIINVIRLETFSHLG